MIMTTVFRTLMCMSCRSQMKLHVFVCVLCLRRTVVIEFYGLIFPASIPSFPPSPLQLTPLYLCNLSNVLSKQVFQVHMQSFMEKEEKRVMLLVSALLGLVI